MYGIAKCPSATRNVTVTSTQRQVPTCDQSHILLHYLLFIYPLRRSDSYTICTNKQATQTIRSPKIHSEYRLTEITAITFTHNSLLQQQQLLLQVVVVQCVSKNIPDIFSCNSRKHCRIFIMFGTHVTEKLNNQWML